MTIKYPVRCKIVDATGHKIAPGLYAKTPEESKAHIGKEGIAEESGDDVKITLDDGSTLWGYECWWIPLNDQSTIKEKV